MSADTSVSESSSASFSRSSKLLWLEAIRLIAIIQVIVIHVTAQTYFLGAPIDSLDGWLLVVLNSMSRVCVPLFFMVSGYLLLSRQEPVLKFFNRRFKRILTPLFAWSLIYLAMIHWVEVKYPSGTSSVTPEYMQDIIDKGWGALALMFVFPLYYHLWFLYSLSAQYLLIPLWRNVYHSSSPTKLWYVLVVLVLGVQFSGYYYNSEMAGFNLFVQIIFGSATYVLAGSLVGRIPLKASIAWGMLALGIGLLIYTVWGTAYLSLEDGKYNMSLVDSSINIFGGTVAAFYLMRYVFEELLGDISERIERWLSHFGELSFGVYLIHPVFLYAFSVGAFGFVFTSMSFNGLLAVPSLTIVTLLISAASIWLLGQISFLRIFIGLAPVKT
ncbi:acyltransferase [Teredinibacter sp. KSP-S5-2]|uniref:acyltransferase n=1 Tax=Teredinibacter sp. KSP-S5-2 TaxID=3034506 RepID=UPI002934BC73|nr:acyltransferase family protein [Teredinibacter sp. KSP-S5-2]WNO09944.1 acyltransferase family protein [Teredinibacter sp. KSP-S5-2]